MANAITCLRILCGKFVSEHTALNKVCGVLLFAVPLGIDRFSWLPACLFIVPVCGVATVAAIQEGYYIRTGKEIR